MTRSIVLLDDDRGCRLRRDEDGGFTLDTIAVGSGSPHPVTMSFSAEDLQRLAEWAAAEPSTIPAWTREDAICGYVRKPKGKKPIAIARDDGTYEVYRFETPYRWPVSGCSDPTVIPSVWHAMAAADAALVAAGHTLTDPAPEPPDLSRWEFTEWVGSEGRWARPVKYAKGSRVKVSAGAGMVSRLNAIGDWPTITTREQADAFLRACGATLEGA